MDSLLKEIKQISIELSSTEEIRNHLLHVKYVIENYILQGIMPLKVKMNPKHELKIIQNPPPLYGVLSEQRKAFISDPHAQYDVTTSAPTLYKASTELQEVQNTQPEVEPQQETSVLFEHPK